MIRDEGITKKALKVIMVAEEAILGFLHFASLPVHNSHLFSVKRFQTAETQV